MKKTFSICLLMTILLSACSNDNDNKVATPPVSTITVKTFYLLSNTLNQFIVYHESNGHLYTYDYEQGNYSISVINGDKLTVTCKVGELLLPVVSYKIETNGEVKNLFSVANTTQHYGYRLMQTATGDDHITIQF